MPKEKSRCHPALRLWATAWKSCLDERAYAALSFRWRWLGGVLILILIVAAGRLLLRGPKPDKSLRDLQARGELKVCMDASYPPFEWIPEGAPADHLIGLEGSAGDVEASALQRKVRDLAVRRLPEPVEVLDALRAGEVDAALTDHLTALQAVYANDSLMVVGEPLTDDLYVIAVRRHEDSLLAAINGALVALRDDGTLDALKESWFSRK